MVEFCNSNYGIFRGSGACNSPDYQQGYFKWLTGIVLDPGSIYGKSYVDIQGGGLRVTSGNVGIGGTISVNGISLTNVENESIY